MDKKYAESLLKKTRDNYNAIAGDFSSTRRFVWQDLQSLAEYTKSGDKVLDLGCGNGRLVQIFGEKEIDYIGVDNSENLIKIAKINYPNAEFQVADALNLPFPTNFFDKVYSVAVLHHIPSKELRLEFLEEARRVLKPEGLLILTVWNLWQTRSFIPNLKYTVLKILGLSKLDFKDVFISWGGTYQRYFHCFSQKELKNVAEKSGLKIEKVGVLKRHDKKGNNIFIVVRK